SVGATTSVRLSGRENARYTAFAAATVDFPHCLVQFTITLRPARNTIACISSAGNPSESLTNSTTSGIFFGPRLLAIGGALAGLRSRPIQLVQLKGNVLSLLPQSITGPAVFELPRLKTDDWRDLIL